MAKRGSVQRDMFSDVAEDLPLFSGTCMGVTLHRFDKDQAVPVQGKFAACPICYDTGVVFRGDKLVYCTCEAGQSVAACRHSTQGQEVED